MGHHFVPFLYLPGILSNIFSPPYISGPLIDGVSIVFGLIEIYKFARVENLSKPLSRFLVFLFLITPTFRHGIFWGIHDETFVIGTILWAYLFWKQNKNWRAAILLIFAGLTKESMWLITAMATLMMLSINYIKFKKNTSLLFPGFLPYLFVFVLSSSSFFGYFYLQPIFLGKSFDHFNKIASMETLFNLEVIGQKLLWLGYLLLPFLALPLWKKTTTQIN